MEDKGESRKMIVAVLTAILGSTGINQGLQMAFPLRADPWTSKDAQITKVELTAYMDRRFGEIERQLGLIEYRLKRAGINGVHE